MIERQAKRLWLKISAPKDLPALASFLIMAIFTGGICWGKVSAYDDRIIKLEVFKDETGKSIAGMAVKIDELHYLFFKDRASYDESHRQPQNTYR